MVRIHGGGEALRREGEGMGERKGGEKGKMEYEEFEEAGCFCNH